MTIEISEVNITLIRPNSGHIGFASFLINDSVYCGSIAIYVKKEGGLRLIYPSKKRKDQNIQVFHPIKKDTALLIEEAIKAKLKQYNVTYIGVDE